MRSLNNDMASFIGVDKTVFDKLVKNTNYFICNYIEDAVLNNEPVCNINIGIGTLSIKMEEDSIRYNFVPSPDLEAGLVDTLENGQNFLVPIVNTKLVAQLNAIYDELL